MSHLHDAARSAGRGEAVDQSPLRAELKSDPTMTTEPTLEDDTMPTAERLRDIDEAIATDTLSFFARPELIGMVIDLATALEAAEARARTLEEARLSVMSVLEDLVIFYSMGWELDAPMRAAAPLVEAYQAERALTDNSKKEA